MWLCVIYYRLSVLVLLSYPENRYYDSAISASKSRTMALLYTNVFFFSVLRDSVEEILVHLSEYLAIYSKVFRIYLRKVLVNMHLSVSLHFSRTSACALVSVKSSEKEFHSNKRIDGLNISFPESVKSD